MAITKSKLALIHVAKKQLALDDTSYRTVLEAFGGVKSAKHLTDQGFQAVMEHFERSGFRSSNYTPRRRSRPGMATIGQIKKIYKLWWRLGESYYTKGHERQALRGFLKKRFGVNHENFLTLDKAGQVIEAVKAIKTRG